MSAAERAAVTQEVLDQAHLWRTMAAQKHGVPQYPQPRNVVKGEPPMAEPVSIPFPQNVTINNQPAKSSWLTKAALATALIGGTAGVGGGTVMLGKMVYDQLSGGGGENVAAVEPAAPNPTGDLLKWLRDNGYNLPPTATEG